VGRQKFPAVLNASSARLPRHPDDGGSISTSQTSVNFDEATRRNQYTRRQPFSYSPPWEPEISLFVHLIFFTCFLDSSFPFIFLLFLLILNLILLFLLHFSSYSSSWLVLLDFSDFKGNVQNKWSFHLSMCFLLLFPPFWFSLIHSFRDNIFSYSMYMVEQISLIIRRFIWNIESIVLRLFWYLRWSIFLTKLISTESKCFCSLTHSYPNNNVDRVTTP
jgi:hypothetical protein